LFKNVQSEYDLRKVTYLLRQITGDDSLKFKKKKKGTKWVSFQGQKSIRTKIVRGSSTGASQLTYDSRYYV
jgi:hypothetical protein